MLRDHFSPHLPPGAAADADALEAELEAALARARAQNPGVALVAEELLPFVASKLAGAADVKVALGALRIEHLHLAWACARGDGEAIAVVERWISRVDPAVGHLGLGASGIDELKQVLRERLLTASGPAGPRIAEYAGRGDLGRWIRAIAVRAGIDLLRARGREISDDDGALADLAVPADDPELDHMRRRYGVEFKAAIREALATLEPITRTELRLYYVDGLTLEELASLYHLVPSTVSRRLASARRGVLDATRTILRRRLGVTEDDVESILRLIGSRLDVSRGAFDAEP